MRAPRADKMSGIGPPAPRIMLRVTQSSSRRPSTTWFFAVSIALLAVGALLLGLGLGLDSAEKMLSIVGSLAGVVGAAVGMVALLRARAAPATSAEHDVTPSPRAVPAGGISSGRDTYISGRDTHIGHKVSTGGLLAVGGVLATLYLVLGAVGVAQSEAGDTATGDQILNLPTGRNAKPADPDGNAAAQADTLADRQQSRRLSLKLSTSTVRLGDTYVATVTGLSPGERVLLHWTGSSSGTIGIAAADSDGRARMTVREGAEPGSYTIRADAERSAQTAEAPLLVVSGG